MRTALALFVVAISGCNGMNQTGFVNQAQEVGVTHTFLAGGIWPGENATKIEMKGTQEIVDLEVTFDPGGTSGWHYHPGPTVYVVTQGTFTEHEADGCTRTLTPGNAYFDPPNVVHMVTNDSGAPASFVATLFLPCDSSGCAQPVIEAPAVTEVCGHDSDSK